MGLADGLDFSGFRYIYISVCLPLLVLQFAAWVCSVGRMSFFFSFLFPVFCGYSIHFFSFSHRYEYTEGSQEKKSKKITRRKNPSDQEVQNSKQSNNVFNRVAVFT